MPVSHTRLAAIVICGCLAQSLVANDDAKPAANEQVQRVIAAAGGEEKLLKIFRFRERVLITSKPALPVAADEKGNRTSVVQVNGEWWIGPNKRDKDKVRVLLWGWSLRILLAPDAVVHAAPAIEVLGKPAFGLQVTGAIKEPMVLYFDQESLKLAALDYTDTRHLFSDWKRTEAGHLYPAHVAGYRFADKKTGRLQENQWYQTDILELAPLAELPAELK